MVRRRIRKQVAGAGAAVGLGEADFPSIIEPWDALVAVSTFPCQDPMGKAAATHSWAWGREGRLICQGSLGGALGMGGDSQRRSACSPHILLFSRLYPLAM